MSRGPGPAAPRPLAGVRKAAPRSLSCLSELDRASAEPRPGRALPAGDPQGPRALARRQQPQQQQQRRARSLPSSPERRGEAGGARGAPCRPGCSRQLRVRFADALGLELAQVRVFRAGDAPAVPLHVLSGLAVGAARCCGGRARPGPTLRCLVPDFAPPVDAADFAERLRRQRVCLERVTCSDLGVRGAVRVCNVAFEKHVAVRYSLSGWRSAHEAAARWRGPADPQGAEDVFAFAFPVPPFLLARGARVHFALRYRVAGAEYWDNNDGRDYSLTARDHELHVPSGDSDDDSWIHFV